MIIITVLALHTAFVLLYMYFINKGVSHLKYSYMLYALVFPFVGELCFISAEIFKNKLEKNSGAPETYKRIIITDDYEISPDSDKMNILYNETGTAPQEILWEIIKRPPKNIVSLLKRALDAEDLEVVHLASSMLMKYEMLFENKIRNIEEQLKEMPNNKGIVFRYLCVAEEYSDSGLLPEVSQKIIAEKIDELKNNF